MSHILAYDGGGSGTRVGLYAASGDCLAQAEGPSSNPTDLGVHRTVSVMVRLFRSLNQSEDLPIDTIVGAIAGASPPDLAREIARGVQTSISARRVVITHDAGSMILANLGSDPGLLVIAGTGSCVFAQGSDQRLVRAGGHGPILGDRGSAYQLVVRALRMTASILDTVDEPLALERVLCEAAGLNRFEEFRTWVTSSSRSEIAGLAPSVVALASDRDVLARTVLDGEAENLAELVPVAQRKGRLEDMDVPLIVHGGLLRNADLYRSLFAKHLQRKCPEMMPRTPEVDSHRAAYALAALESLPEWVYEFERDETASVRPTEQMDLSGVHLDSLTAQEIAATMNRHDEIAASAVAHESDCIAALMLAVADAFQEGGRLVYIGAGTSGRLGILDASECPPTFGVPQEQVIGLIAGGEAALRSSIEGAEDDREEALEALKAIDFGTHDVLVGISASGSAAYVRAALDEAKRVGATTGLVCCNPECFGMADHTIILDTGPEALPGSTRLKAGTATKLVLNQISTGAMALSGRVFEGLMVGVQPVNTKLHARANAIVRSLTACTEQEADRLLERTDQRIPIAVLMNRANLSVSEAEKRLEQTGGNLRAALSKK